VPQQEYCRSQKVRRRTGVRPRRTRKCGWLSDESERLKPPKNHWQRHLRLLLKEQVDSILKGVMTNRTKQSGPVRALVILLRTAAENQGCGDAPVSGPGGQAVSLYGEDWARRVCPLPPMV